MIYIEDNVKYVDVAYTIGRELCGDCKDLFEKLESKGCVIFDFEGVRDANLNFFEQYEYQKAVYRRDSGERIHEINMSNDLIVVKKEYLRLRKVR